MKIQITFILAMVVASQCVCEQPPKGVCNDGLTCPIPENRQCIQFHNQCTSDKQCIVEKGTGYMCCLQPNCGLECKVAVAPRGLHCPIPDNKVCKQYLDQCTSDAQCMARGRRYKCCLQPGCGLECKVGVF